MGIFRLPALLYTQIRAMIVNFWWGVNGDEKRIHQRKWQLLCRPKSQGGLDFRDLISFNQSLLAKQAWRILTNPESLAARIYKMKYFPASTFLKATLCHNPSYVWRSVLWGRDLLVKGLRWRIATGSKVYMFQDPWQLRPKHFKPITVPNPQQVKLKVCELMTETGQWDWDKVDNTLWEVDREELMRIPAGTDTGDDKLIWHYSPKGEYTVNSGYYLTQIGDESSSNGLSCGSIVGYVSCGN